jgi:C4-dicarboxylate transporter DctQ subunit
MKKRERNLIKGIGDFLCRIEKEITWVAFIVMLALLVIQVLCRYVLKMPLAWSEELMRYIYIGVSFLGAAIAVRENSHICIDLLPQLLGAIFKKQPKKEQIVHTVLSVAANIVCAAFWLYITMGVLNHMLDQKARGMITTANQWPTWIVMLPVVISGGLMILHYLLNTGELFVPKEREAEERGIL